MKIELIFLLIRMWIFQEVDVSVVVVIVVAVDVGRGVAPVVGSACPRGRGVAAAPALELPGVHTARMGRKMH